MRELDWMVTARLGSQWAQTSIIIQKLHNANFAPELKLKDINPFYEGRDEEEEE